MTSRSLMVATQLALAGTVIPRSVHGAVVASHRAPDGLVPPTPLNARQAVEIAADDLCIAVFGMLRAKPDVERLERSVHRASLIASEVRALGIDAAHPAPPPVTMTEEPLSLRYGPHARLLEWDSRPVLPEPLTAYASRRYVGHQRAAARVLQHPDGPRPWVVWTHGAAQGHEHDLRIFRARWLHQHLGLNLAFPVQPGHGHRSTEQPPYPGFDIIDNVTSVVRAVWDVRTMVDWVRRQGAPSISVIGTSLGAPVTALVAHLEPSVEAVAMVVPLLDMHGTMAYHAARTREGRRHVDVLASEPVRAVSSIIDATAAIPHARPELRTVVAAQNDQMASARDARRLHDRWGGEMVWCAGGHVGRILSGEVRHGVVDHLRRWTDAVGR